MGATQDAALQDATMQFVMDRARDQDVPNFFGGLAANFKARRPLVAFFEANYDLVRFFVWRRAHATELTDGACAFTLFLQLYKRFEGNFTLKYLVTVSALCACVMPHPYGR